MKINERQGELTALETAEFGTQANVGTKLAGGVTDGNYPLPEDFLARLDEYPFPTAQFDALYANDPMFHGKWERTIPNPKDNTLSGFDMALAGCMVRAKFEPWDMLHVIVASRKYHGNPPPRHSQMEATLGEALAQAGQRNQAAREVHDAVTLLTENPTKLDAVLGDFDEDGQNAVLLAIGKLDKRKTAHRTLQQQAKPLLDGLNIPLSPHGGKVVANHYASLTGEAKQRIDAVPLPTIVPSLLNTMHQWPKCVSDVLFVLHDGKPDFLVREKELFSWIKGEGCIVQWRDGNATDGETLTTQGELLCLLPKKVERFDAIELYPHIPALHGHFYVPRPPLDYIPTGEYLERLLDFFPNVRTDLDRVIMRAMFCTPMWGARHGTRPGFAATGNDNGYGKSTATAMVGDLYGGNQRFSAERFNEEKFVSDMLSPGGLLRRVVRIDNLKAGFHSATVAELMTAPDINGHRLFTGYGVRPNTITYLLTTREASLSRDLTQRVFYLELTEPKRSNAWEKAYSQFKQEHTPHVLADIEALLRGPKLVEWDGDHRYAGFAGEVLARCTDKVDAVLALNTQRQGANDMEVEEAETLRQFFYKAHTTLNGYRNPGYVPSEEEAQRPFYATSELMREYNHDMGTCLTAAQFGRMAKGYIRAGRLPGVTWKHTNGENGYVVDLTMRE